MKILMAIVVLTASTSLIAQDDKVKIKSGLENPIKSTVKTVSSHCDSTSIDFTLQAAQVLADERENINVTYKYTFTTDEVVEIYDLKTTKTDGSKTKEKVNVKREERDNQMRSKSFTGHVSGTVYRDGEYVKKMKALMLVEAISLDKAKRDECNSHRARLSSTIK